MAGVVQAVGVHKGPGPPWLALGRMQGWQRGPSMGWPLDLTAEQRSALRQQALPVRRTRKGPGTRGPQPQTAPEHTATRCVGIPSRGVVP